MSSAPGCSNLALKAAMAGPVCGVGSLSDLKDRLTGKRRATAVAAVPHGGDEAELARVRAGDREAYRYFVEKYQERAHAIAFSVVRDAHDAEDIVQESFVKAYLSLAEFRAESGFYTWLYRIVYNMAVDFKRRAQRRQKSGLPAETVAGVDESPAGGILSTQPAGPQDMALRKEQGRAIGQVLAALSDEHRAVMVLREVDGLSYDEIARVVGVSKGTVMSRLFYARRKMQEALAEFAPSGWKGGNGAGDAAAPDEPGSMARTINRE